MFTLAYPDRRVRPRLPVVVTGGFDAAAHRNPAHGTLMGSGLVDT